MRKLVLLGLYLFSFICYSQDDLLSELEADIKIDSTTLSTFKALKIVNLESTKLAYKKDFYFIIAHRFGAINQGIKEFFGLDQSTIRFSLIYGISNGFNIGVSRSSFNKVYDFAIKYRFIQQENNGFPFTIGGFSSVAINTAFDNESYSDYNFSDRITYLTEFLISRKFNKNISLELVPIFLHENYVQNSEQKNTQFALGAGGRVKIWKRVSFNMDYAYHFNRAKNSVYSNPLSIGFDVETGGHVFQLNLSNTQAMYDAGLLTSTFGDWSDGSFYFGFNISRLF